MAPENFCYWLQGKLEDRDAPLSQEEVDSIKAHLALVMTKVTTQEKLVSLAPGPVQHPLFC